jgi:hypothetical protein
VSWRRKLDDPLGTTVLARVSAARDHARVNAGLTSGLFGLGGVVLGVGLNAVVAAGTRKRVTFEQWEQARHARELVAAEQLDEALIRASEALDRNTSRPLEERYADARRAWAEGWVSYSPRVRQRELLDRYEAVGSILAEVVLGDRTVKELPRHIVARALANARSTLAHFMRGEDKVPGTTFPEPAELRTLLANGDGRPDPMRPLKEWLSAHPMPEFHEAGEQTRP